MDVGIRGETIVKIRALLAAGIAAAATAAAFAVPGLGAAAAAGPVSPSRVTATVTAPPPVQVPGLRIHVVNLHSQFERALTIERVVSGPQAGVVPMANQPGALAATAATGAASAASRCKEPNCKLSRHGGPVQHAPHVYLLLWGPDWRTSGSSANAVLGYLAAFFHGLGQTSYDRWSTITSQYKDAKGHPAFGAPVLNLRSGIWNDPSRPPARVTPNVIAAEAGGLVSVAKIKDTADAQVVVAFESHTCFSDGFGGSCGRVHTSGYCAWHSAAVRTTNRRVYVPFINLPWQLDAGAGCGANFVNRGTAGLFDGWSMTGGHEYAEAITDPKPRTGYIDTADKVSGGEVADKCVWGGKPFRVRDPFGDVTLPIGTNSQHRVVTYRFAMQSLWSNANGRCVMRR
jgi:hypothetical protein